MELDRLMFDNVNFSPCTVTARCVRSKVSIRPHISYDVVIHVVVKEYVLEFIGRGGTNKWIVFCELHQ